MAKTLLNGVNEVLKKVDVLDSDSGLLTTLIDSARQGFIDLAVQVLNELIDELYGLTEIPKPRQLKEATITLVATERTATLKSDMITLRPEYGLVDRTNNHVIDILESGGHRDLVIGDIEQDDTGLPNFAAIDPTGKNRIHFDRAPTASEAGREYTYFYDRDLELVSATDVFPFDNQVFRAIVPAAAELWTRYRHKDFDEAIFNSSLGRAARHLSKLPARTSWGRRGTSHNATDPMHDSAHS